MPNDRAIVAAKLVAALAVLGLVAHFVLRQATAAIEFESAWDWAQAFGAHTDAMEAGVQRWATTRAPKDAEEIGRRAEAAELRRTSPLHDVWYQERMRHWENGIAGAQQAIRTMLEGADGGVEKAEAALRELRLAHASVRFGASEIVAARADRLASAGTASHRFALVLFLSVGAGFVALRRRRMRTERVGPRTVAPAAMLGGIERILSQLPTPMLLLEPVTGRVRLVNAEAARLLGVARSDLAGRPFACALAPTASGTPPFQASDEEAASAIVALNSPTAPESRLIVHTAPVRADGRSWLWTRLEAITAGVANQAARESRSYFRLLAESIPGATFLLTRRGEAWTVSFMGPGVRALTGLDPQVFTLGRRELDERIHEFDRPHVVRELDAAVAEGRAYFVAYRLRHLDGSERWIEEYGQAVRDERGVVRHLQGTLFDVTKRRESEAALLAERERQAIMLRSIADAVVGLDAEGAVRQMNAAAVRLFGVAESDARGRRLESIVELVPANGGRSGFSLAALLRGAPRGRSVSMTLTSPDRGVRHLEVVGAPLYDPRGDYQGVVAVLRDVTDHLRREEELLRAAKLESVGVLAGGIAHDFNNILAGIIGNLSLARMEVDAASDTGYSLQQALDAAVRAQDLTRQLLTFAKGGAPMRRPVVLTKGLLDTVRFALRGSNVRCVPQIDEDLPAVEVDQGQILQVVQNLVINATQAMPEGGTLDVVVRAVEIGPDDGIPLDPGRFVEIVVADRGCGIPPESLQRIFDPYFTTKAEGTGLGLATSYSIVRRHGGTILVESTPGVGSTFHVYLPTCASPLPQPEDALDRLQRARCGTGRLLVVDDEGPVRDVCSRMLRSLGYRPTTAEDGQQAVELYAHALGKRQPFDLVLMDLNIPGDMGGAEATRRILDLDPEACVIASSAQHDHPILRGAKEHGFRGSLRKPYRQEDLGAMLRTHLGRAPAPAGSST